MNAPEIVNNLLSKEDYDRLILSINNPKNYNYESNFSRYSVGEINLHPSYLGLICFNDV